MCITSTITICNLWTWLHYFFFRLNVLSTNLRKLRSLLRKSPFTQPKYEYEYEMFYNLDYWGRSTIWSLRSHLRKFYNIGARCYPPLSASIFLASVLAPVLCFSIWFCTTFLITAYYRSILKKIATKWEKQLKQNLNKNTSYTNISVFLNLL